MTLAKYGAHKVYVVDDAESADYLVAPQAEILAALVEKVKPAAVLIPSNTAGKEIAARLAIKTESGLITDAVDVRAGENGVETTQSVFAGSYTVTATVTKGTPIIAVKPNSVPLEASAGRRCGRGVRGDRERRREGARRSPRPSPSRRPAAPS